MKTTIKVHVLFLQGHHIELLLENPDSIAQIKNNSLHKLPSYYCINRWREPNQSWLANQDDKPKEKTVFRNFIALKEKASEQYSFEIEEDPKVIVHDWIQYYEDTKKNAHIFGENCAVATQWFLSKYAQIPRPAFWAAPVGINQVMYYFYTPSFIPHFALLPKRVFDNAKFHLNIRNNPNVKETYLTLNIRLASNALTILGSLSGILLASKYLSKGINSILSPLFASLAISRTPHLFSDINKRAAKILGEPAVSVENNNSL